MSDETTESAITTPIGSLSFKGKRMAEFIAILCLCLLILLGYVQYQQKEDLKDMNASFTAGFKEMAAGQREQNSILREQLCLLALPPEKREREFLSEQSFCKRLSRER